MSICRILYTVFIYNKSIEGASYERREKTIDFYFHGNPLLFFELRGIDINRFIDVTLKNHVDEMLDNAYNQTSRMMDDDTDINSLFGVL